MITKIEWSFDLADVEVEFSYSPAEKQEQFYPGCDSSVEIESVTCKSIDLMPLLSKDDLNALEEQVCEAHEEKLQSDWEDAQERRGDERRERDL